jgi:hypothetical protein
MQALHLNWPKCPKGYEILSLRRSGVDWSYNWSNHIEPDATAAAVLHPMADFVPPPADATQAERRLLARWGTLLGPIREEDKEDIARVIEPRNETTHTFNVLVKAPDLFVDFANINDSEDRLLQFIDSHGALYDCMPQHVSCCLKEAAGLQKVLGQFERDKGSKRWLSSFEELRWKGLGERGGVLNVVPKINAGEIQVLLEPPDLLSAVWLQFLLKAASLSYS